MKQPKFRPNAAYLTFLSRLRLARQEKSVSQRELARRLNWHWSKVIRSENGARPLTIIEVRAVCQNLGLNVTDFTTELEAALTAMEAEATIDAEAAISPLSDQGETDEDVDSTDAE